LRKKIPTEVAMCIGNDTMVFLWITSHRYQIDLSVPMTLIDLQRRDVRSPRFGWS